MGIDSTTSSITSITTEQTTSCGSQLLDFLLQSKAKRGRERTSAMKKRMRMERKVEVRLEDGNKNSMLKSATRCPK
jgi:hypothetical protein